MSTKFPMKLISQKRNEYLILLNGDQCACVSLNEARCLILNVSNSPRSSWMDVHFMDEFINNFAVTIKLALTDLVAMHFIY